MLHHYSRHYYLSDDLDDLEQIEEELEARKVTTQQIHVYSENDSAVEQHHNLHGVSSIMHQDLLHSLELGALVGVVVSLLVLVVVYATNLTAEVGWVPFIFLAIVMLGFCTWEGGLYGIQAPNKKFSRFEADLHKGKHIFFVDIDSKQEKALKEVLQEHPKLTPAGLGTATPDWLMQLSGNWRAFRKVFP